jgi:drug/metabolite transporter (DMT)-like permease
VVALVGSTLVFKRLRTAEDLLAANTVQLGVASVALLPLALLLEGAPRLHPTAEFSLSLAYLILVMSVGATFLWFWLLRHGEASRVSAFYFLTPIFGLALGALLLGETVRPLDGLGLAAVAAGIVLVQSSRAAPAPRPVAAGERPE